MRPGCEEAASSAATATLGAPRVGDGPGAQVRAAIRWLVERRLVLAGGLAAALPIIVSMINAVAVGWVPLGDNAYTALRAFDVFTDRSPLVGQWSGGATSAVDKLAYSPGPLLFWLLAVPARFFEPSSLPVAIGLINVVSVMGVVGLAHRRGGWPLAGPTAIAIPLMLASLPPETYSSVWNSSAILLPFMLLIFLAWSVACGDYRLLPVTVLVGSFVAQTHLAFVGPTLGVTVLALGGFAVSRRRARRLSRIGRIPDDRRTVRRWALATALVGLVCWSAPLIEQATEQPGNLDLLWQAATTDEATLGQGAGWRAVVHTVGIRPWWLRDARDPLERLGDLTNAPGALAFGSTLLVLGALAAVTLLGWLRRRRELWAAGVLGLALCAAVGANAASTPQDAAATVEYTLRWASPAGMYIWLVLGWSITTLIRRAPRRVAAARCVRAAVAGVAVAAAVGGVVAVVANPPREHHSQMRVIADRLEAELPSGRLTRIEQSSSPGTFYMAVNLQAGTAYALRRAGWDVTAPTIAAGLGSAYRRERYDQLVRIDVDKPPAERARLIARVRARQPYAEDQSEKPITVSLARTHR